MKADALKPAPIPENHLNNWVDEEMRKQRFVQRMLFLLLPPRGQSTLVNTSNIRKNHAILMVWCSKEAVSSLCGRTLCYKHPM